MKNPTLDQACDDALREGKLLIVLYGDGNHDQVMSVMIDPSEVNERVSEFNDRFNEHDPLAVAKKILRVTKVKCETIPPPEVGALVVSAALFLASIDHRDFKKVQMIIITVHGDDPRAETFVKGTVH